MGARSKQSPAGRRIESAVRRSLSGRRVVLAVSGGRDSMVLLRAAERSARRSIAAVATFDHGTGPFATEAAEAVARECSRLRLPVVIGHARVTGRSEAEWRDARHQFLRDVARRTRATLVTAHTQDDQTETVLMRLMRDAGPRGLAGLYAETDVVRPLLGVTREEIARHAAETGITWLEDPTNESMYFLRNRLRRDLLPALARADPELETALLRVAKDAAAWRRDVDAWALRAARESRHAVTVAASRLVGRPPEQLAILWPAIAARAGLAMDWRGTERAAAFTTDGRVGSRIQLAGGWEITRGRDVFELGPVGQADGPAVLPLRPGTRWLGWRFTATDGAKNASDEWVALLPENERLSVRRWQPGDRMRLSPGVARRVKRFLSDAHVSGSLRGQWPVVLAGKEIVWIPGVRRSDAAAVRPGRPGVLYRCVPDYR